MIIKTADLIMNDFELALNYFELEVNVYFCSILFYIYFQGKLSDVFGRKNLLLISLFGAAVGYILTGIPTTLLFLALSRVPVGEMLFFSEQ